jgi:hypothetical protein
MMRDNCIQDHQWEEAHSSAPNMTAAGSPAPRPIPGLEARIIPQRYFPLRNWYYANPLWYYHAPAKQHRLRTDAHFYELVDPALRELCETLLAVGLCTTPSCQGHFYPRTRFERIWHELQREAAAICNGGLVVHDCESDQAYRFTNKNYRMPWRDFETFYAEADRHQNEGYLGIALPPDRTDLMERFEAATPHGVPARIQCDEELTRLMGRPLVGVLVEPRTPEERDRSWSEVTRSIQAVLQEEAGK